MSLVLSACGGGGGGGGSKSQPAPVPQAEVPDTDAPTPNAALATIADNTYKIAYTVEDVIKFGQFWSDPAFTSTSTQSQSIQELNLGAKDFALARSFSIQATGQPVMSSCPLGGTAHQVNTPNSANGTLTREITYSNCKDPAATANGKVTILSRLGGFEGQIYISNQTTTFSSLNLMSDDENLTLDGTAAYSADTTNKSFTINLTIVDNLSTQTIQADNVVIAAPISAVLIDRFYQFNMTGKIHFASEGTLDFNKTDAVSHRLAITGKNGTSMVLEAVNPEAGRDGAWRHISADSDADGAIDRFIAIPWSEYYPKGANAALPVAKISPADSTLVAGQEVVLDAYGSTDTDYNLLGFAWSISQRPDGATATLVPANAVSPRFSADTPGVYELSLTVEDGSHSHTEVAYVTVQ